MIKSIFVSDLHGSISRYKKFFELLSAEQPELVFVGGDILPGGSYLGAQSAQGFKGDFIDDFLVPNFTQLKNILGQKYPKIFLILGNDDGKADEARIADIATQGLWDYISCAKREYKKYTIYGYPYVPPTPFLLKDWERYDISRFTDVGCVSPEDGYRTIPADSNTVKFSTIAEDLQELTQKDDLSKAVFLFHSPPYKTSLDRAALDGKKVDHVPLDVHVGSIAIKRFVEARQPYLTLHGHIHESTSITKKWSEKVGKTYLLQAANNTPELAYIKFDLQKPAKAERFLI